MQSTCRRDVNGVEIYAEDIVLDGLDQHVVRYGEGGFEGGYTFVAFYLEDRHGEQVENYYLDWGDLRVIGNIYEHPHLLEPAA